MKFVLQVSEKSLIIEITTKNVLDQTDLGFQNVCFCGKNSCNIHFLGIFGTFFGYFIPSFQIAT